MKYQKKIEKIIVVPGETGKMIERKLRAERAMIEFRIEKLKKKVYRWRHVGFLYRRYFDELGRMLALYDDLYGELYNIGREERKKEGSARQQTDALNDKQGVEE